MRATSRSRLPCRVSSDFCRRLVLTANKTVTSSARIAAATVPKGNWIFGVGYGRILNMKKYIILGLILALFVVLPVAAQSDSSALIARLRAQIAELRSEERRVGKEWRS